jgi:hypothetical protein
VHVASVLSVPQRRQAIYVNGLPVLESGLALPLPRKKVRDILTAFV